MEIILIIFAVGYAVLSWRRLEMALAFLIFALPAYQIRFSIGLMPSTLLEAMVLVLFTAWLVKSILKKELPIFSILSFPRKRESRQQYVKHYPFYREIILILIIGFVSAAAAGFGSASFGILKAYFLEAIMFFIVFVNVFKIKANRKIVFYALALSALLVSILAIYQKITGQLLPIAWQNTGRATGPFLYPNALGLYLGPVAVLLAGYLLSLYKNFQFAIFNFQTIFKVKISEILFICCLLSAVCLSVLAIFLAKSEGALAGVSAALAVMGVLCNKKARVITLSLLALIILTMGLITDLREPAVKKITLMDVDGQIRRQQWAETWQMLTDSPRNFIFGAGLANYQSAVEPYHQSGIYVRNNDPEFDKWVQISLEYQQKVWQPLEIYLYPHNIFLNFWSELGLAGMLVFVWIIGRYMASGIRYLASGIKAKGKRREEKGLMLGLLGAMIVIVVHGMVDVPYFKNDLAIIFWLLVGMLGVYNAQLEDKKPEVL